MFLHVFLFQQKVTFSLLFTASPLFTYCVLLQMNEIQLPLLHLWSHISTFSWGRHSYSDEAGGTLLLRGGFNQTVCLRGPVEVDACPPVDPVWSEDFLWMGQAGKKKRDKCRPPFCFFLWIFCGSRPSSPLPQRRYEETSSRRLICRDQKSMGKYGISYRRTITSEFSQWGSSISGRCLDKLDDGDEWLRERPRPKKRHQMPKTWTYLLGTSSWSSPNGRAIWKVSSSLKNWTRWVLGKHLDSNSHFSTTERWTTPLGCSKRPQLFKVSFCTHDRYIP